MKYALPTLTIHDRCKPLVTRYVLTSRTTSVGTANMATVKRQHSSWKSQLRHVAARARQQATDRSTPATD